MANQTNMEKCDRCRCQFDLPYSQGFQHIEKYGNRICRKWQCLHDLQYIPRTRVHGFHLLGTYCEVCALGWIQGELNESRSTDQITSLICGCGQIITLADCRELNMDFTQHDALMAKMEEKRKRPVLSIAEQWKLRAAKNNGTGCHTNRPCPSCKGWIKKNGGCKDDNCAGCKNNIKKHGYGKCQYMTCPYCGIGFDWRDGVLYDQFKGRPEAFGGTWVAYWKDLF